ncbi:PAS domain-containing protein (plasmid) [Hymenobacter tibetensis]|uniref:histidine kinase n=1 Tax=Hymenobacter tibetensis TaxID=497967 RepID=A0ABY4D5M8_9BACT|nr:PAS domain-containing protein [Hymenobacter tibetensis]UOG77632.1 PAS domain-containing protein [Hymenobacter tibetensis]
MPLSLLPDDPAHIAAILGALPGNFLLLLPDAPTYTIVAMSAELLAQTGREAAQVVGQSVFVAYPENEAESTNSGPAQMRTALEATLRDHQPHELPLVRYDVPAPDGRFEERYWSGRSKPVLDAQGEVLYLLFTSLDLTTQQRAEREQQAREQAEQRAHELEARVQERTRQIQEQGQRLERLFMQAPAAICILGGPDLVFELVNPIYQQFFPERQLLGKPLLEALPELTDHAAYHTMRRVFDSGETNAQQALHTPLARTTDGVLEDRYFNYVQQPRYDEQGRVDGVLVFGFEVTEQVQAHRLVEASEQQVRTLVDNAPFLMGLYVGPELRFHLANQAMLDGLGKGPDVIGQRYIDVVPEMESYGVIEQMHQVLATGQALHLRDQQLEVVMQGTPQTFCYNYSFIPLRDAEGQVYGLLNTAVDVTDLKLANEQLRRTNADLDNFIYTASHDLKAPISNIEGLLIELREHLPEGGPGAAVVPQLLELMQNAVERFQLTIAQLTDLTRLQQAHAQPPEPVDVAELVEAVRLDLAPQLAAAGARLEVAVSACPTLSFSPKNLRSVIYNLLSNAVKYRHPDRAPHVRLHCRPGRGSAVLEVQDNGLGLSEAQLPKLFGMFQRLHTHVEGSGLGLYMVKKIVDNAGGTIAVESQAGVGTTVTVHLPA